MLVIVHNTISQTSDTTNMPLDNNATNTTDMPADMSTESPTNGTNSTDYNYDYYYYDFNSTDSNSTNQTITPVYVGDQFLFTGDNQTRPGLGINVGMITSGMSQWVFTNKFKHANGWRPVSSGNNWFNYSFAGHIDTEWNSDGYPVNFTYRGQWGGNLGYQAQLGIDGVYPTGDYFM